MLVYRIAHRKYANELFASGIAGRWNGDGQRVIYTAESIALAYLETLSYRKGLGFNSDFRIMVIELAANSSVQEVNPTELPKSWRSFRNYDVCQRIGNHWFEDCRHLCLKVPSAVVVENSNMVINTLHPGFKDVKLVATLNFIPDERLEDVIKNHQ